MLVVHVSDGMCSFNLGGLLADLKGGGGRWRVRQPPAGKTKILLGVLLTEAEVVGRSSCNIRDWARLVRTRVQEKHG